MEQQRYVDTGSNSFFGEYLYDQVVPRGHFLRKLKKPMEMIRQQADCRRGEGEPNLHIYPCGAKERSTFVGREDRQTVVCNYREEVDAACGMRSAILRQGLILSPAKMVRQRRTLLTQLLVVFSTVNTL